MVRATFVLISVAIFILKEADCKKQRSMRCFSMSNGKRTHWLKSKDVSSDFKTGDEEKVFIPVSGPASLKQPKDLNIGYRGHAVSEKKRQTLLWKTDDSYVTLNRMKYYLLKIERDETINKSVYRISWFILLGPFKAKTDFQFSYRCLPKCRRKVTCGDMKLTLWPLPDVMGNDNRRIYRISKRSEASISIRQDNSTIARIQREADTCHCQAKIAKVTLVQLEPSKLTATAIINNKFVKVTVQFYLVRNETETIEKWLEATGTNMNETELVKRINVKPGKYVLKAEKHCNKYSDYSLNLPCDKDAVPAEVSKPCVVQGSDKTVSDVKEKKVFTVPAPEQKNGTAETPVTLMISFPVVGVLFLVITVSLTFICCRGRNRDKVRSRTAPNLTGFSRTHQRDQELVAVLYVKEHSLHLKRVYSLCAALQSKGIRALPIDEFTRNREMIENWIAEGERISNTCGSFLFVLSRTLVEVCRSPYQNRPQTGRITDREMPPPVGHSRLPLVVLNSIRTRALFNYINVQTVYLENYGTDSAVERRDLCSSFTRSHSSIVSSETHNIGFLDDNIVRNQELSKLACCFRNTAQRPSINFTR